MAATIPPIKLTKEDFNKRVKLLIEQGKPVTLRNIDPNLAEFVSGGSIIKFFKKLFNITTETDIMLDKKLPIKNIKTYN